MQQLKASKVDNLSSFAVKLKEVENAHVKGADDRLKEAHRALVKAVGKYRASRMDLGRALHGYHEFFKARRGWLAARDVIATKLGYDARTIQRIIEGYERASKLPEATLTVLEKEGIDPTAKKHASLVGKLIEMPARATREEADQKLSEAVKAFTEEKQAIKITASAQKVDSRVFAERMATNCEARMTSMSPEEKQLAARFFVEYLAAYFRVELSTIRSYTRPTLVPVPYFQVAA